MKKGWVLDGVAVVAGAAGILASAVAILSNTFGFNFLGYPGLDRLELLLAFSGAILAMTAYAFLRWRAGILKLGHIPQGIISTLAVLIGLLALVVVFNSWYELESARIHVEARVQSLHGRLSGVHSLALQAQRKASNCLPDPQETMPEVKLEPVIQGLTNPVYVTHAKDNSGRLFLVEKQGLIRILKDGALLTEPFLDISERVVSDADTPPGNVEQGLLSVVFHPAYSENGRFFVNYTAVDDGRTIVAEYRANPEADTADPRSEHIIIEVAQPDSFHNGGQLQFGPEGFLYIGMGDGGVPATGQDLGNLLGSILRIDIDNGDPYTVPPNNPFIFQDGVKPEIFAFGFRNPWRFSFDLCDGSLFVGDVGAISFEEVDIVVSGGNYGWGKMEGMHCNNKTTCDKTGLILPIAEYGHLDRDSEGGNSVTGGFVYRGTNLPGLRGYYVFADFASRRIWSLAQRHNDPYTWDKKQLMKADFLISSFGEGEKGELYVVDYSGSLYMLSN